MRPQWLTPLPLRGKGQANKVCARAVVQAGAEGTAGGWEAGEGCLGGPSSASGDSSSRIQPVRASSIARPHNLPTWGRPDRPPPGEAGGGHQSLGRPSHPVAPPRHPAVLGRPATQKQPIPEIPTLRIDPCHVVYAGEGGVWAGTLWIVDGSALPSIQQ